MIKVGNLSKKKYKYFVSFYCTNVTGQTFANTLVISDSKITSFEDINNMTKFIESETLLTKVVIINWVLFDK